MKIIIYGRGRKAAGASGELCAIERAGDGALGLAAGCGVGGGSGLLLCDGGLAGGAA